MTDVDASPYPTDPRELDPKKHNILIPSINMAIDLPPGVKFKMAFVKADTSDGSLDFFKSGRAEKVHPETGESKWMTTYSLSARFLDKLKFAMRIDMQTQQLDDSKDPNFRMVGATVRHHTADGRYISNTATAEFRVDAAIDEFRHGLEKELEADPKGTITREEWHNRSKRTITLTGQAAIERIESEVRERHNYLKKYALRNCETRAKSAAMRSLIGLKDSYAPWELQKPFVVFFYEFPPVFGAADTLNQFYPPRPASEPAAPVPATEPTTGQASPAPPPQTAPNEGGGEAQGPPPAKNPESKPAPKGPSLEDRIQMALKDDETLSETEMREIVSEMSRARGISVSNSIAVQNRGELKVVIQTLSSIPPRS